MAVLTVSDIIIAVTLLVNALALVSSKVIPVKDGEDGEIVNRLRSLTSGLRKYSLLLVFWNVIFLILMTFVFNS